eukprot:COSAG01_NODE_146_length_24099_cov_25.341208_3_plen_208_part_00
MRLAARPVAAAGNPGWRRHEGGGGRRAGCREGGRLDHPSARPVAVEAAWCHTPRGSLTQGAAAARASGAAAPPQPRAQPQASAGTPVRWLSTARASFFHLSHQSLRRVCLFPLALLVPVARVPVYPSSQAARQPQRQCAAADSSKAEVLDGPDGHAAILLAARRLWLPPVWSACSRATIVASTNATASRRQRLGTGGTSGCAPCNMS